MGKVNQIVNLFILRAASTPYYGQQVGGDWRTQYGVQETLDPMYASHLGLLPKDPGGAFMAWLKENAPELASYKARKAIAKDYGIENYKGDADQNWTLWQALKKEKARRDALPVLQLVTAPIQPLNVPATTWDIKDRNKFGAQQVRIAASPISLLNVPQPSLEIRKHGGKLNKNYFDYFKF